MTVETIEHRVRRGETLQDIVQSAGFPRREWRRIYDATYNRAFKSLRPDPDSIQPGDRLMLPRFNAHQIADIVQRIVIVERRLMLMDEAISEFERDITQMERTVREIQDASERDVQRRIAALERRAQDLHDLSTSCADECEDMYSCMGAGAAATRFEIQARRLRSEANNLQRNVKKGEKSALKNLKAMRDRLRDLRRAQSQSSTDTNRLRALYRRAAQNPY